MRGTLGGLMTLVEVRLVGVDGGGGEGVERTDTEMGGGNGVLLLAYESGFSGWGVSSIE
jgi:hypothetical protein